MDDESLVWVEQRAKAVFDFGLEARAKLNREVHVTVSFVAIAMATAFGTGIRLVYQDGVEIPGIGLLVLAAYLAAVLAYGVIRCIRVGNIFPPSADPKDLLVYLERRSLAEARHAEVISMQERIDQNNQRNWELAKRFSLFQNSILLAPVVYVAVVAAVRSFTGL